MSGQLWSLDQWKLWQYCYIEYKLTTRLQYIYCLKNRSGGCHRLMLLLQIDQQYVSGWVGTARGSG